MATVGNNRVTIGHLRVTIGYLKATVVHIRVFRSSDGEGHLPLFFSLLFFL